MCLACKEAMDIQEELYTKYGDITVERLLEIARSEDAMDYFLKSNRMQKILAACPKTPEFLGKEGAYRLASLTNMKDSPMS
jgi:hypothetical protein